MAAQTRIYKVAPPNDSKDATDAFVESTARRDVRLQGPP